MDSEAIKKFQTFNREFYVKLQNLTNFSHFDGIFCKYVETRA